MSVTVLPIIIASLFWGVIGIGLPFFVPKGPNRGTIQCCLVLTGISCWLFWICCYFAQMNPLIGPSLDKRRLLIMANEWGNPIK